MSEGVIEPSRAGAHEEREQADAESPEGTGVIDPLRAPTRNLHETWRSDLTKTAGQLMAEEGIDRKEAQNRVLWARRQQKRQEEFFAAVNRFHATRRVRKPEPGRTPLLETETSSTDTTPEEAQQ